MTTRTGTEIYDGSNKKVIVHVGSSSTSSITSQNSNGIGKQKSTLRSASAKYYDVASTILGGSGDVEEVFLNAAKNGNLGKLEQLIGQSGNVGLDIDCRDKRTGNTALIWAAKRGHVKIVETLLRHGVDATLCNHEAQTAVETAHSSVRTVLLDWVETQKDVNNPLLLQAAWQGNLSVVKKILTSEKRSVDVNCRNVEGLTPLMLVTRDVQLFERLSAQLNRYYSPVQVADELIKAKANIHVTDNDGRSSLHYASQSRAGCADKLVSILIAGGMEIELRDKNLFAPIHLAAQLGNTNNVIALADGGSDVNVKGFAGSTPLHVTAYNDHQKTADTLLRYGADVTLQDDRGLTPVDLAKTRKMKTMLKEAWIEATKGNTAGTALKAEEGNDAKGTAVKKRPEVIFDGLLNPQNTVQTSSGARILSNVERCKQAEKKILLEVEALKAAHPSISRETTRILGTTRSKILPQIGRSSSPENTTIQTSTSPDTGSGALIEIKDANQLTEEARKQLMSRGRSVSEIKLGIGRQSSLYGSVSTDDESLISERHATRFTRTSPFKMKIVNGEQSKHRRSGSDPSTPSMRDLAECCDSILPPSKAKSKVISSHGQHALNKAAPTSQTFITQSSSTLVDKRLSYDDEAFKVAESLDELPRCHSILKEEFVIAESRPREVASGSDPTSSSSSSLSSSSPRDLALLQQSCSRTYRHDLAQLETLVEQQAFLSTSEQRGLEGGVRPIIKKPRQRLRSENSLSSSLESESEVDVKSYKLLSSIKSRNKSYKTDDKIISSSSESSSSIHRSQSLEVISPRSLMNSSASPILQRNQNPLSHSDDNINFSQKKTGTQLSSKSSNTGEVPKLENSQSRKSFHVITDKTSQKTMTVKPFSGKARVLVSAEFENWVSGANNLSTITIKKSASNKLKSSPATKSNPNIDGLSTGQGPIITSPYHDDSLSKQLSVLTNHHGASEEGEATPKIRNQTLNINEFSHHMENAKENNSDKKTVNLRAKEDHGKKTNLSVSALAEDMEEKLSGYLNHSDDNLGSCSPAQPSAKLPMESGDNITKEKEVISGHSKKPDEKYTSARRKDTRPNSSTKKSPEMLTMDSRRKSVSKAALIEKTIFSNQRPDTKVIENINVAKSGDGQSLKVSKDKEPATANKVTQHSSISLVRAGTAKSIKKVMSVKQMTPTCKNTSAKVQTAPAKTSSTQNPSVMKPAADSDAGSSETFSQKQNEVPKTMPNTIHHSPTSFQSTSNNSATTSYTKPSVKTGHSFQATSSGSQDSIQKRATQPVTLAPQVQRSVQFNGQPKEATVNCEVKASSSNAVRQSQNSVSPITTPLIVDPFAEFAQSHVTVIETPSKDAGAKPKKSISAKHHKKVSSSKRPNSGSSRQSSAGKKRVGKGRDLKAEKEPRPRSTKKNGRGKIEKEDEDELYDMTEAIRTDVALVTGIGWQMETSCSNMENVKLSREINLSDSDTEFTDRDQHPKNMHLLKISKENLPEPSPRFLEMKRQKSVMDMELPVVEDDGYPPMNLDMTNQFPKVFEGKDWDESKIYNYQNIYHNDRSPGQLTTISEASFLSRSMGIISDTDVSLQKETKSQNEETSDGTKLVVNPEKRKPESEEDVCSSLKGKLKNQNQRSSQEGKPAERSYSAVQRTQSLKEMKHARAELKFSERENPAEKDNRETEEDNLDDVIEEILSSTTSSLSSNLKSVSYIGGHNTGSHTLTYGDRKILDKMTKLNQDSPFYATSSLTPTASRHKGKISPVVMEVGDCENSSQSSMSPTKEKEQVGGTPDDFSRLKPPSSACYSLMEEGMRRQMSVRRSCSTKAVRRRTIDQNVGSEVNEEEAKHLAKVINSFKQMELTPLRQDGGSAKSSIRNSGTLLVTHDLSGTSRPGSSSGSFRSKGRFRELKDGIHSSVTKMSADAKLTEKLSVKNDAIRFGISEEEAELLEKLSATDANPVPIPIFEKSLTETRRGSLASSECNMDTIKGEDDTIQWKKGNILGKGAFGTVWCGLTNEGQLIAVKQIELTTMDKLKAQLEYEKVQEEVELLKTLEHTNIVGYLGTSLEDNIVSIFMQFIPGGSLASILARFGALDEAVFRRYTKQILEGVRYLHENDVIHRDLKGANVMLMPNGVIKLIDFGCAKRMCINLSISQTEILKSMKGTPYWMAPEVVSETGHGKKSDIWSIGCTVFEMATRKPPWSNMNPMAAIFAIGSPERPVPSLDEKFSEDARDFVEQCMTRDQELRPDAHQLLHHPFIIRRPSKKS